MIDSAYIAEIKELSTKESKAKLAEYAAEFNIKLNKTKTFDNMLTDLEAEFAQLAAEYDLDHQEDQKGLNASDLIDAFDESENNISVDEVKEEAKVLIEQLQEVQGETPLTIGDPVDYTEITKTEGKVEILEQKVFEQGMTKALDEVKEVEQEQFPSEQVQQPESVDVDAFIPTLSLLGPAPGYYTLSWWLYDWILENSNWKDIIDECKYTQDRNILKSLAYYAKKNGNVTIRETRNSRFVILE